MKFHIVQMNETIEEITFLYNLTVDELKEENRHIRKWDKLIPGTKLKIPVITEAIDSEVAEMEPFIEDYYPKIQAEDNILNDSTEVMTEPIEEEKVEDDKEELDSSFNEKEEEKIEIDNVEEKEEKIESTINEKKEETPKEIKNEVNKEPLKNNYYQYPYINPYYSYYYHLPRVVYPVYYPIYFQKKRRP